MRGPREILTVAAAIVALVAAGCGDEEEPAPADGEAVAPARGFSEGTAPLPPEGDQALGRADDLASRLLDVVEQGNQKCAKDLEEIASKIEELTREIRASEPAVEIADVERLRELIRQLDVEIDRLKAKNRDCEEFARIATQITGSLDKIIQTMAQKIGR